MVHRASCSCGQLTAEVSAEPARVSVCHCFACQRRTGSVFGAQARFAKEHVRVQGRSSQYRRIAASGRAVVFEFCPDCGATVHYSLESFPDVIAIPVGAFADPDFPAPAFSVFESCKHAWAHIPGQIEHSN